MVMYENSCFIFGGWDGTDGKRLNDIYKLEFGINILFKIFF